MRRRFVPIGLATASLFATTICIVQEARAQQGAGVVAGRAIDASTKQPLADVVVTVTSPALQGEQLVVTDRAGVYRLPNLPPGEYTVRLDREAYRPFSRGGILLRADSTIQIDADMLPESIKEEIVVVGRPPTIDVGSAQTGVTIDSAVAQRVPLIRPGSKGAASRSLESVAEMAPGARADDYGVSVAGSTSPENGYLIDGLSVSNGAYGILGSPLSIEFVKEVNVITGGYMPEYGRATGGIISGVTKSGSNEFHGSAWLQYTPGGLEGTRKEVKSDASTIRTKPKLAYINTIGADIGGPIVEDKLWFYAGFQQAQTGYSLTRSLYARKIDAMGNAVQNADGSYVYEDTAVAGTEQKYWARGTEIQAIGKLTWQANRNNRVALTMFATPSFSGGSAGTFGIDPQTGGPEVGSIVGSFDSLAHKYKAGAYDASLKWTSEFDNKRALLDTTIGYHHEVGSRLPWDGSAIGSSGLAATPEMIWRRSANPGQRSITEFENNLGMVKNSCTDPDYANTGAIRCPVSTYVTGGAGFLEQSWLDRMTARTIGTLFREGLGHHVLKAGLDFELNSFDHLKAYSGSRVFRENASGTTFRDYRMFGYLTGPDTGVILSGLRLKTKALSVGGFVQDSWSIFDRVTLNAGLRYDAQFIYNAAGEQALALPNQISPRVGAIWDPTKSGRAKLFAHYAVFYEQVPLDLADRAASGEPQISGVRSIAGNPDCKLTDNDSLKGACSNTQPITVNGPTSSTQKWLLTGAGVTPIDPNLKPQSSSEFLTGGEYDIIRNGRIGVSYTKRWVNNVIEDMSRDEATTYFIGNPGSGIAKDFPKAERNYDAGTVYFQKMFSDDWYAQASYTVSYLRGNYAGLFRPETGQFDPNINSDFDLRSLLANRTGPLPGDHRHEVKLFAARDFQLPNKWHVNLGGAFRGRSGEATSYLGSHPLYGSDEVYILPRGSGDRLPWVYGVDTNIGAGYHFGTSDLVLTMDVFNLLNFQAETARDERYTDADVLPLTNGNKSQLPGSVKQVDGTPLPQSSVNTNFGNAVAYQAPRQFRFGLRITF